jgi:hypothetical protein
LSLWNKVLVAERNRFPLRQDIPEWDRLHLKFHCQFNFPTKLFTRRFRIAVKMIRPRIIALYIGLFVIPSLSFAQTSPSPDSADAQKAQAPTDRSAPLQGGSQNTSQNPLQSPPPGELPNAPSSSKTEPSLGDLGFSPSEVQANAKEQALLDKRTHMLKIHQRMGLITTIPLIVTVATSLNAGGKNTSSASRDLHTALGGLTGDLYGITAYYAIRAPRVPGTETRGPIRFHKVMAWIHGPGMIATPILGIMAFDQKNKGEKVHGIAQAHGPVAIVTAGAFGAALLSVSLKF